MPTNSETLFSFNGDIPMININTTNAKITLTIFLFSFIIEVGIKLILSWVFFQNNRMGFL